MANTLFLRLEGPLQAWGERSRWSVRDSAAEPTKSGIVGLLACALGLDQDKDLRELSQSVRVGVRCDRAGLSMIDYHTVGGGYDKPMLLTAEGKPKLSSGRAHNEQTWRTYLADASFLVAVQGKDDLIAKLANAVQNPIWPFFLGRKSCPPARPIFDGLDDFKTLEEALTARSLPVYISSESKARVRAAIECPPNQSGATRRRDEINSRSRRTFLPRYAYDIMLEISVEQEAA
ncbi:MAG: type I-E CRISPR-associated protein Cas5/CasD [Chloroflexi bacterium]|nr:type I-E CRISPR-associated protein Cas5/CasD [Chloroflexota bacterium]